MPTNIVASTQQHLEIETIKDGIVILKNGAASMVLQTTAVNFDLLSIREQDAAIAAYSALLNSLSFPIQVVVRSKKMDITIYIQNVKKVEAAQTDPKLKEQTKKYVHFVEELVSKNEALDKNFYVSIPYNENMSLPGKSPFGWLAELFGINSKKKAYIDTDLVLKNGKMQLEPKRDHLIKEFTRMGIRAKQLSTEELIELYYDIYNPGIARLQKIKGSVEDYTTPIVEPKLD